MQWICLMSFNLTGTAEELATETLLVSAAELRPLKSATVVFVVPKSPCASALIPRKFIQIF
jgi:hypothetical protein